MSSTATPTSTNPFADLALCEVVESLVPMMFRPSKTFPDGPAPGDVAKLPLVQDVVFAAVSGQQVLVVGDPGTGKTSFVEAFGPALTKAIRKTVPGAEDATVKIVRFNCANLTPEELIFPWFTEAENGERALVFKQFEALQVAREDPNIHLIVILDEPSRAPVATRNQLLELIQKYTLGDVEIPNLLTVIACDNVEAEDGIRRSPDFAFVDRFSTVQVTSRETPWMYALAAHFPEQDLTDVFKCYWRLAPKTRKLLSPRTLQHVLECLNLGLPARLGLPIVGTRVALGDTADATDEVLAKVASAFKTHNPDRMGDVAEIISKAIDNGLNLFIQGPPGIAKTAVTESVARAKGMDVLALSMAVTSPENLAVITPAGEYLTTVLLEWFEKPSKEGKVLILDELWRAPAPVRNRVMEILQERSLGGKPIRDLRCVIGLNNPKDFAGLKLDVGRPDRAQADRFAISIEVTAHDLPWQKHLLERHGALAELVLEWWANDLDEVGRGYVTARCIERIITRVKYGLAPDNALPFINGDYVGVPLHHLHRRLNDRPVTSIRSVLDNVDRYEEILSGPDGLSAPEQWEVLDAFLRASSGNMALLEEERPKVLRLLKHLSAQNATNLVRSGGDAGRFWVRATIEGRDKRAAVPA